MIQLIHIYELINILRETVEKAKAKYKFLLTSRPDSFLFFSCNSWVFQIKNDSPTVIYTTFAPEKKTRFMEYTTHTLANGLRMVHLPSESPVAYCGFAVNAGARDEQPSEYGLAHFVEHMILKVPNAIVRTTS